MIIITSEKSELISTNFFRIIKLFLVKGLAIFKRLLIKFVKKIRYTHRYFFPLKLNFYNLKSVKLIKKMYKKYD